MNTKHKGNLAELMSLAGFVAKGHTVSIPYGENSRYDLVVDFDGVLKRVQVKSGRLSEDGSVICFNTKSSYHNMDGSIVKKSYKGEIDLFAVFVPKLNKLYALKIEDVKAEASCNLRLSDARNGQVKGIIWAKDFEFHDFNL